MKKIAVVLAVAMGLSFSGEAFAKVIYPAHVATGQVIVSQPAQRIVVSQPQVVYTQPVQRVVVQQPQVVQKVVVQQPVRYVQPMPVQVVASYPQYHYVQTYHQPVQTVYVQQRTVDPTFRAVAATVLGVGLIAAALAN